MSKMISISEYMAERKAKQDAFDLAYINVVIEQKGEAWVCEALELFNDIEDKKIAINRADFEIDDEVLYVEDEDAVGQIKNVKYEDGSFSYFVRWADEDEDWFTESQLKRL